MRIYLFISGAFRIMILSLQKHSKLIRLCFWLLDQLLPGKIVQELSKKGLVLRGTEVVSRSCRLGVEVYSKNEMTAREDSK
jgi:hypothetical protein